MDYRMKYMVNEGVLLLSYAYAASGYITASAALGIFSIVLAVFWHSGNCFLNNLPKILAATLIQVLMVSVSLTPEKGIAAVLPAFCNTAVSSLWMESSRRAVRPTIRILAGSLPVFLVLSAVMPERAIRFLTGSIEPRSSLLIMVLMIFLPPLAGYARKTVKRRRISLGLRGIPGYNM
ncbi:MAG: hypothetical protein IIZ10_08520 [Solobacterium sp.]|nr:hypothetical protein [Solobacterium sp.]